MNEKDAKLPEFDAAHGGSPEGALGERALPRKPWITARRVDLGIYVLLAAGIAFLAQITSDDAKAYISGRMIFWLKALGVAISGGSATAAGFRHQSKED